MNNLNIEHLENYLNIIFDLEKQMLDKDFKIRMLEFELEMEKGMNSIFRTNILQMSLSNHNKFLEGI